jgi:hypothetical protein
VRSLRSFSIAFQLTARSPLADPPLQSGATTTMCRRGTHFRGGTIAASGPELRAWRGVSLFMVMALAMFSLFSWGSALPSPSGGSVSKRSTGNRFGAWTEKTPEAIDWDGACCSDLG